MLYNINPSIWGKSFWDTIYYIIIAYSDNPSIDDKTHVKNFLESLQYVLPCENCSSHYSENLKKTPLTNEVLSSRYSLLAWMVNINNDVNRRTGKPDITPEDIIYKYTQGNKSENNWKFYVTMFLLVLLIIILIYYVKKC
jgi:hypothetical protein